MKPAFPAPASFNASVILPLLPIFLLGAAILSGGKKTLVKEVVQRDQNEKFAASEAAPRGLPYGPFTVTRTPDVLLKDIRRSKDVPVTVIAPDASGPFPLIVFSHSAGGDGTQNESLLRWWASHGYVVVSPTHSDSIRWQQRRNDLCSLDDSDAEEGSLGLQSIVHLATRDPQAGVQRARDVTFVLNSLNTLEDKIPSLSGKIDRSRVGVAGNSLGAYTAQLVGGATVSVPSIANPMSFRDPRAKAILQFSGQGTGQQGLTRESWKAIHLPMMTVTGSKDNTRGHSADWKRESFDFSPATGNKYYVFIEGAHHGSFGGRFASRRKMRREASLVAGGEHVIDQKAIFSYVEETTLAFWDSALKSDADAKTLLEKKASAIAQEMGVTATVACK